MAVLQTLNYRYCVHVSETTIQRPRFRQIISRMFYKEDPVGLSSVVLRIEFS